MANVLPAAAQKRVWAVYRSRFLLVTGLMILGLSVVAAFTLIPSYVALEMAAPAASAAEGAENEGRSDADALERSRFLIRELKPVLVSTSSPMSVVETALGAKPPGVRITRVIYREEEEGGEITLIGAGSRDQVSAYRDALVATEAYSGVAVPVGALVGSTDGGFSIVVTTSL